MMRVAKGHEIDINGHRYLSGDELPVMSEQVTEQLIESGDIERPVKKEEDNRGHKK